MLRANYEMRILDHRGHEIEVSEDDEKSLRVLSLPNKIQVHEKKRVERIISILVHLMTAIKWGIMNPQTLITWFFIYIVLSVFYGDLQPKELLKSEDTMELIKLYKKIK